LYPRVKTLSGIVLHVSMPFRGCIDKGLDERQRVNEKSKSNEWKINMLLCGFHYQTLLIMASLKYFIQE
jgi:hypothetical protein